MTDEKALTIFDTLDQKKVNEAIQSLIKGKTPKDAIKERPGRGGKVKYVETYYVVDQLNKLFCYRWNLDIIDYQLTAKEAIVKGQLTCTFNDGTVIQKTQFGQADLQAGIPNGDMLKAAGSDCLKKCASLIGIALDVYWGKEDEFFAEPKEGEEVEVKDFTGSEAANAFNDFVKKHQIKWSEIFEILKIKSPSEITDYKDAHDKIKEAKKIK